MRFVLDASVTLAWLLRDANARSEAYAFDVLKLIRAPDTQIEVPATWCLEIANVVAGSEGKGHVTEAESEAFLELLRAAPITVDPATAAYALSDTVQLARRNQLSAYDASTWNCVCAPVCPSRRLMRIWPRPPPRRASGASRRSEDRPDPPAVDRGCDARACSAAIRAGHTSGRPRGLGLVPAEQSDRDR